MKFLVALCAIAASAVADSYTGYAYTSSVPLTPSFPAYNPSFRPAYNPLPVLNDSPYTTAYSPPYQTYNKYFVQDIYGQLRFGFSRPGQAQDTVQDVAGNKVGTFTYVNPEGKQVQTNYVIDASNNLPAIPLVQPFPVQSLPVRDVRFSSESEQVRIPPSQSFPVQTPASTSLLRSPNSYPSAPYIDGYNYRYLLL